MSSTTSKSGGKSVEKVNSDFNDLSLKPNDGDGKSASRPKDSGSTRGGGTGASMDSVSSHSTKQSGKTGASSFEASPLPNVRANFGRLKLAEFVVKETLGTGTFGRVRLAMHKQTGRHFALKIAKKREVIRLKQIDHVRSEKDLLSRLDHPFIVKLYGTSTSSNYLYMLMEYVVGGEIFSHLRAAGRFPEATARFYAAEIILAVEYLHSMDVVYRDLKPENLLLDKDGHLKITDFGFAKVVESRTWTLCGTPEYLAPEIIQNKGHGKAVDWWALGILIYEMVAGYPPFYDDNTFGTYEKILTGVVSYPKGFSKECRVLIGKLLMVDVGKRLGNLRGGAADVRGQGWFDGLDWMLLLKKQITPPIRPFCKDEGYTGNFERYPDSVEDTTSIPAQLQKVFENF